MKTINVYSFAELCDDAKKKAINSYRTKYGFDEFELEDYMDSVFAGKVETLSSEFHYNYSLNHCQGDGVCFYGDVVGDDLYALAKLVYLDLVPDDVTKAISNGIIDKVSFDKTDTHYCHKYTVEITVHYPLDFADELSDDDFNAMINFQKAITIWYRKTCDDLERLGYYTIDMLQSDEFIADTLKDDDVEYYLADGTRVL
jgi:hypothetical protein